VVDLLEQHAQATGVAVGVQPDGVVYARSDPSRVLWYIDGTSLALADSDVGTVNRLSGRYRTSTGGYATARSDTPAAAPIAEEAHDLTPFGTLTHLQAVDILNQMLAIAAKRPALAGSLTLHRSQITNQGGAEHINLAAVRGGQKARLESLPAAARSRLGGARHLDIILGSVTYTDGSDYITVEAAGTPETTFADAMKKVRRR